LVSGGYDGRVTLWKDKLKPVWSSKLPDLINQVSVCKKQGTIAVACADSFIYGLDVNSGNMLFKLGPHKDDVNSVSWHPEGKYLVSVADFKDGGTHLWNVKDQKYVSLMYSHESAIYSVKFNCEGNKIASSGADYKVRICDFNSRNLLLVLDHGNVHCESVAWTHNDQYLITGCADGRLMIWDLKTGEKISEKFIANSTVRSITVSGDGDLILVGSYDGIFRLISFDGLNLVNSYTHPFQWERNAVFYNEGVVICSFSSKPILYKIYGDKTPIETDNPLTLGINTISANKNVTLCGVDDGSVFDFYNKKVLYKHNSIVNSISISNDGTKVASVDYQGKIQIFCFTKNKIINTFKHDFGPINSILWARLNDTICLITGGYDGYIRWWDSDLKQIHEKKAHLSPVKSIDFCQVTKRLVCVSSDNTISGWDGFLQQFNCSREEIELFNSVSIASQVGIFATASRDLHIRTWNLHTGELLEILPVVHKKSIKSISISSDGNLIVSGSYDACAVLWQRRVSGWETKHLKFHSKPGISSVVINDNQILTSGWDGLIASWSLNGELLTSFNMKSL
jgi:WD40 repeat protein